MLNYIIRRILIAIPTLIAISMIAFVIIQLPPGDYLDQKIAQLEQQFGDSSSIAPSWWRTRSSAYRVDSA